MEIQLDLKPFELPGRQNSQPIIIAGPCSAESEDQLMKAAEGLLPGNINLFRAGIWKPRTRPGGFQGFGAKALPWLKKVKEEFGIPVATEVANEKHVHLALKYDIDVLWIGARTTANPFAVEEIANALEGKDIPVMVKNPINPDLKLWLGAIERLNMKGIKRLAAIHRGFSSAGSSPFRNPPQWDIPQTLKQIVPHLPVLNDPSHICGNRNLLLKTAKKAMDRNMDGLMIEVHPEPDKALSDAKQQITPQQFHEMMDKLQLSVSITSQFSKDDLELLRRKIDLLDDELLNIIEQRMNLATQVGKYKQSNNLSVVQKKRWEELLLNRIREGSRKGLDERFVKTLFDSIHKESVSRQEKITVTQTPKVCSKLAKNH